MSALRARMLRWFGFCFKTHPLTTTYIAVVVTVLLVLQLR